MFAAGRLLGKSRLARIITERPGIAPLQNAVQSSDMRVVMLLRLSPVTPFNIINCALALFGVSWGDFVLGSAMGMLPVPLVYTSIGAALPRLTVALSTQDAPAARAVFWGGIAVTVAIAVVLTRAARRALARSIG